MADKTAEKTEKIYLRFFVYLTWVVSNCCYVGPQEIPLPDTFINPSFQVAHYLWEGKTTQIVRELDKVHKPSYILATPEHTLYISSFLLDQVLYVADTRIKGSPAVTFTQGHGLDGPWGMVADLRYLYVPSFTTDQIHKYDLDTKRFVGAFGNESYLDCPEGMAIGPNDTLYVASFLNDKVVKFSIPDGEFLGVVADKTHGLKGYGNFSVINVRPYAKLQTLKNKRVL